MQHMVIPGLMIFRAFLSDEEHNTLINVIDSLQWSEGSIQKRRVQHYGVTYDYETHQPNFENVNAIPQVFDNVLEKVNELNLTNIKPNQLIINEYIHHQGIGKHIDPIAFGDYVFSISLGSSVPIIFSSSTNETKHTFVLEPGSLLIMSGEARRDWNHEIPYSKLVRWEENGQMKKFKREKTFRRVSLTMRCVPSIN